MAQSEQRTSKPVELKHAFDSAVLRSSACDENGEYALMTKNTIYFFDSATNQFKRQLSFDVDKLNYSRVPQGTKVVIVLSDKKLFFVEVDTLKIIHTETLTNNEKWVYYFVGTNKFMTEKTEGGKITYTGYSFDLKDPRVCAKTCGGECPGKNFS